MVVVDIPIMEMKKVENVVKVSIEEDLSESVSGFGRYQIWQCLLAVIPIICTALSNTNFVFAAASIDYRCAVPQCEVKDASSETPAWWPSNVTDVHCTRPVYTHNSTCSSDDFETIEVCDQWIYDTGDSIVNEFNLACHEWKRTLVGTVHNLGVLISMPLMGYISDRIINSMLGFLACVCTKWVQYTSPMTRGMEETRLRDTLYIHILETSRWGRKTAIILSGLCLGTGALKILAGAGQEAYITYVLIEFFEAVLVTGTYTTCFVLIVELIGSDKRTIGSAAVGISVAIGELILTFIVWNIPYWRHFLLLVSCPAPIFLLYPYILEESMRWLLTNGRNEKALMLLQRIASWNRFAVSDKVIDEITRESKGAAIQNIATEKFNVKLLFSSPALLKRVLVCSWWWFTAAFVYYGLMINSVGLPGNKYANFALSSLATIPGDIIAVITLDRVGRKKTLLGGFVFCGVCCVSNGFIPQDYKTASIAVFLIGKTSISACFNAVYVYTSELVPTSARGSLVGTCSMVARVGTVLAPLTPLLSVWWRALPTALFGCASLSAAALTLATPETLRRRLPDTVAEATAMA